MAMLSKVLKCMIFPIQSISRARLARKKRRIYAKHRQNLKHGRLPEGKATTLLAKEPPTRESSPFLRLPKEIRLMIYKLALQVDGLSYKAGRCVLQPGVRLESGMRLALHGPYPSTWGPRQHIRTDDEPPSMILPSILALGGSATKPLVGPPGRGCVRYGCYANMLCGDQLGRFGWEVVNRGKDVCHITSLLRVCSVMYREVLPLLYAKNTMSLFGAEMVSFYARNASPDGLKCVRNVHLILRLDSSQWIKEENKLEIVRAIETLKNCFGSLKQLDIEVAITWGAPTKPEMLWTWITGVFARLEGLDEFVLKVSVLQPLPKDEQRRYGYEDWDPERQPISSWSDSAYQSLKLSVTS